MRHGRHLLLLLLLFRAHRAHGRDLFRRVDDLLRHAKLISILAEHLVPIGEVENLGLDRRNAPRHGRQALNAGRRDRALRHRQHGDVFDLDRPASDRARHGREKLLTRQDREDPLDQRPGALVLEPLDDRTQHLKLFLLALRDLEGRHVLGLLRQHQEQVVEKPGLDPGLNFLDVLGDRRQALRVHLIDRRQALGRVHHVRDVARKRRGRLVLEFDRSLEGRVDLLVDELGLALGLDLQLDAVAQHVHSERSTIGVVAGQPAPRGDERNVVEPANGQRLRRTRSPDPIGLSVCVAPGDAPDRFGGAGGLHREVRFDHVGDDALDIEARALLIPQLLHVRRAIVQSPLLDDLGDRLGEQAGDALDAPRGADGQEILADDRVLAADDLVRVLVDQHWRRAEHAEILEHLRSRVVGVGLGHDRVDLVLYPLQPDLPGTIELVRVYAGALELEPRARRGHEARHEAGGTDLRGVDRRGVEDGLVYRQPAHHAVGDGLVNAALGQPLRTTRADVKRTQRPMLNPGRAP